MSIPDESGVESYRDLAEYVALLVQRVREGSIHVANPRTVEYLDSAAGWISDMDGYFLHQGGKDVPENPTWELIAKILSAALVYE